MQETKTWGESQILPNRKPTRYTHDGRDYIRELRTLVGNKNIFKTVKQMEPKTNLAHIDVPKIIGQMRATLGYLESQVGTLHAQLSLLEANLNTPNPSPAPSSYSYDDPYKGGPIQTNTPVHEPIPTEVLANDLPPTAPIGTAKKWANSGDTYYTVTDDQLVELAKSGRIKGKKFWGKRNNQVYVKNLESDNYKDDLKYVLKDAQVRTLTTLLNW